MRGHGAALVLVALIVVHGPANAALAATPRAVLYAAVGFSDSEQAALEAALERWGRRVRGGQGSSEAWACAEQAAGDGPYAACLVAAEGAGDTLGAGLLGVLAMAHAARAQDPSAALAHLEAASRSLDGVLAGTDGLRVLLRSSRGALLAVLGRHEEALPHFRQALELGARVYGDGHVDRATNHLNLGLSLYQLGRAEASATALAEAQRRFTVAGVEDLQVLLCLATLGAVRLDGAEPAAARQPFVEAAALAERILGPDHAALATHLGNLGEAHLRLGEPAAARPVFDRALDLATRTLGPNHAATVTYRHKLATVLLQLGEARAAVEQYGELRRIYEQTHGPEHLNVAVILDGLAEAHQQLGEYDTAAPLLERVLAIYTRVLGPQDGAVATVLGRQAELLRRRGDLAGARALYARAVADLERARGPEHADLAAVLVNQANVLREIGDFAAARQGYERALAIYERTLGPGHPFLATALANLAALQEVLGDHVSAEQLGLRALGIYTESVGLEHPWVAVSLNNLARLFALIGKPADALPLLEQAVGIWERTLGPDHPEVLGGWSNLADLKLGAGDAAGAQAILERALAALERTLGPDHPQVGLTLAKLAAVHQARGAPRAARPLLERAVALQEAALGPAHREVAQSLSRLASVCWALGERDRARALLRRVLDIAEQVIAPLLDVTSERERLELIRAHRGFLNQALSLLDRPADGPQIYAAVLRWKAVVQGSLAAQRAALHAAAEPQIAALQTELDGVRHELAGLVFAGSDAGTAAERAAVFAELTRRKEALERTLSTRSAAFRRERSLAQPGVDAICVALGQDSALLDVLRYHHGVPAAATDADATAVGGERYAAFLLLGGPGCAVRRLDLGPARAVDAAIARYRRLIQEGSIKLRLDAQARKVRALIWDPVARLLGTRRQLWVVPDGALSGLPLAALVDDQGRYLVERLAVAHLASAAELLAEPAIRTPPARGALVAGGLDFDDRPATVTAPSADHPTEAPVAPAATSPTPMASPRADPEPLAAAGPTRAPPVSGSQKFPALEASAAEVTAVAQLLERLGGPPVRRLTGGEGREARLRQALPGTRFVHLATHGFFATGKVRTALDGHRTAGNLAYAAGTVAGYNPLVLSGVVLAGANARQGYAGGDDGLLTAEEVVGLDLRGTDLVTLSACETGLGEVESGEGVLGLRRAFSLAGAGALLMSLWKVPDQETRRLMTLFYERLAGGTADKAAALAKAQRALIAELRSARGEAHPLFWGGFILSGR